MNKKNSLEWLQHWYQSQCDGDWEHEYGIKIDTVDNPGWYVTINLAGTELESKCFKETDVNNGPDDWVFCIVRNTNFEGSGDPKKLLTIIEIFQKWATR